MAKGDVTRSGQKLHGSPRTGLLAGMAPDLALQGASPTRAKPGHDNRGQRHIRNDRERLSVEPRPRRHIADAHAHNPRFVQQGSGQRRCSICAGPHPEYRCPVPPAEKCPAVLGLVGAAGHPTPAPEIYRGRGRVIVLPPGAFGADVGRVRRLVRRKRTRERLDGADALIAGALLGAKRGL